MKKYVNSEFVATKYGIYKAAQDIITSFPSTIIANGGNIAPWAIYGNEDSGDYVGDKTANLFDGLYPSIESENPRYRSIYVGDGNFTLSSTAPLYANSAVLFLLAGSVSTGANTANNGVSVGVSRTVMAIDGYITIAYRTLGSVDPRNYQNMLNAGSIALPYEPYGYDIPIVVNNTDTYHCYITDVLRKSDGETPVYDTMSSDGTITRRVDTDGTPLVTPTSESFTPPTIATAAGNNSINFGTTVKPSKMELTYTGWHMYDDKKYSGGWG